MNLHAEKIRERVRKSPRLFRWLRLANRALNPFLSANPVRVLGGYVSYIRDFTKYRSHPNSPRLDWLNAYPSVLDKQTLHPLDYSYFYQDTWAAGKVFQEHPSLHLDIGSTALFVGILSQFTRVLCIDIRPLDVTLTGLASLQGSILELPLASNSIESISSLCVIEHIGLGRYGDPIDPMGTVRAAHELVRVLAEDGNLYVSVPIEVEDAIHFNAHRAFSIKSFAAMFAPLEMIETRFIQGNELLPFSTVPDMDIAAPPLVGLFQFTKR